MTDPNPSPIIRHTSSEDTSVLTLLRGLRWTFFALGLMALGVTVLFLFLRLPAVIVHPSTPVGPRLENQAV